jgi:hypothetical protein
MKIKKVTLDGKEIAQAVEAFLATKGINLPVHSVAKPYHYGDEWEVVFQFEVEADPAPAKLEAEPEPTAEPL